MMNTQIVMVLLMIVAESKGLSYELKTSSARRNTYDLGLTDEDSLPSWSCSIGCEVCFYGTKKMVRIHTAPKNVMH